MSYRIFKNKDKYDFLKFFNFFFSFDLTKKVFKIKSYLKFWVKILYRNESSLMGLGAVLSQSQDDGGFERDFLWHTPASCWAKQIEIMGLLAWKF